MCHYISAALPTNADLNRLGPIAENHRFRLTPFPNASIITQLSSSFCSYLTTTGHCDCGTVLGSANRGKSSASEAEIAKQIAAFQRRGWTPTKIARWQEQQTQIANRTARIDHDHLQNRASGATDWVQFVQAILASRATDRFGLLLHWYRGITESEQIEFSEHRSIRSDEIDESLFLSFSEDVFYEFRA